MIGLVACSSQKLDRPAVARKLYTSPLFQRSIAYAERRCMAVYVLSAVHALVPLDAMIEPYDHRLGRKDERARWGRRVVGALLAGGIGRHEDLFVLAGEDYARPLRDALRDEGWSGAMYEPLHGKQVGQRLAFLNAELAAMPLQLPAPGGTPRDRAIAEWLTPRPDRACACTCEACCDCRVAADDLACSFCGKTEHQVKRMISGPRSFICDGCVALCVDLVDAAEAA